MTESLEYPDYSLVVLYRGLVIGCCLVTPEGYLSYLFIHPEWRSTSLATKLLYLLLTHLLPPGRDLTAHVAAGNPAVILYQRIGFKPEEYIVDFYGGRFRKEDGVVEGEAGYNPSERNALFMRLRR